MTLFESYSPRAKRVVFFARYEAFRERENVITPEHFLRALIREDSQLFAIVAPEVPDLAEKLQHDLAVVNEDPLAHTRNSDIPLSPESKDIIRGAEILRQRFDHKGIATQHLLLAILVGRAEPKGWRGWRQLKVKENHSRAQRLLLGYGLTVESLETRTKEGIVTPATWVLDEPLCKLNAQLNALAELLIAKGVFRRPEFVQFLDNNEGPITAEAFLLPLLDALVAKNQLNAAEKEKIVAAGQKSDATRP